MSIMDLHAMDGMFTQASSWVSVPTMPSYIVGFLWSLSVVFLFIGGQVPTPSHRNNSFWDPQESDRLLLKLSKKYIARPLLPLAAGWYLAFAGHLVWAYEWRLSDRENLLAHTGSPRQLEILAEVAFFVLSMYVADVTFCLFHFYFDQSQVRPPSDHRPDLNHWRASFQRHHRDPVEVFKLFGKSYSPLFSANETIVYYCWIMPPALLFCNTQYIYLNVLASPWIVLSQPIHYYNHACVHGYHVPLWFKFLQKIRFVQHYEGHHSHHTYFDRNFAITNGWCNPLMNIMYKRTGLNDALLVAIDMVLGYPRSQWGLRVQEDEVEAIMNVQALVPQKSVPTTYGSVKRKEPSPADVEKFERAGISANSGRLPIHQGWEDVGQKVDHPKLRAILREEGTVIG